MAKAAKKSATKATSNTNKKATITQPPVKKSSKPQTPEAAQVPQPDSSNGFEKQKEAILKKYPNITEDAFHRYDGEGDESVLRRVSERAGVSYKELLA